MDGRVEARTAVVRVRRWTPVPSKEFERGMTPAIHRGSSLEMPLLFYLDAPVDMRRHGALMRVGVRFHLPEKDERGQITTVTSRCVRLVFGANEQEIVNLMVDAKTF